MVNVFGWISALGALTGAVLLATRRGSGFPVLIASLADACVCCYLSHQWGFLDLFAASLPFWVYGWHATRHKGHRGRKRNSR